MIDMSQYQEPHGRFWLAVMEYSGSDSQSAQLRGALDGAGGEVIPAVLAVIVAVFVIAAFAVALVRRGVPALVIGAGIFATVIAVAVGLIVAA